MGSGNESWAKGLNWARRDFCAAPDRYLAEECRVAAAWFTSIAVATVATGIGGSTAFLLAASYHKSAIACYIATLAASLFYPIWVAYTL